MTQIRMDPQRIAVPDWPSSGNPVIAGRLRAMAGRLEVHGARPFRIVAYPGAGEAATRRAFMAQ
jgi:hypothetical protein